MLRDVRAFAALVLVTRTHILVPNVYKSSAGGFNTLFGLPKVLHTHSVPKYMHKILRYIQ